MDKVLYSCLLLFVGISAQLDLPKSHVRKSEQVCLDYAKKFRVDMEFYIVGGVNARLTEFPHMAAVGFQKKADNTSPIQWRCGGSLISENFVLTAAHCFVNLHGFVPAVVRLGKVDLLGNDDNVEAQDIRIAESYIHPEHSNYRRVNDIALLRLEKVVNLTDYVQPACLYTKNNTPQELFVTGWGRAGNDTSRRVLLKAQVEPVELAACRALYQKTLTTIEESQLCAKSGQLTYTCQQGNTGGPIQVRNRQNLNATSYIVVGMASFGPQCDNVIPSAYTRVYNYLDWIESIVWPEKQLNL